MHHDAKDQIDPHTLSQRIHELERENKQLRERLEGSRGYFNWLFTNSPLPYQSLNEHGIILDVNQAWLNALGYERQDVIGVWFGNFLADDSQDHFLRNFTYFKKAGEIHGVEFRMRRKDGSFLFVTLEGRIGKNEQGKFEQTHCVLHDLTQRREAEERLRNSEQRYRELVEELQEGIWVVDAENNTTFVNRRMAEMLGYEPGEMLGRSVFDFMDEENVTECRANIVKRKEGICEYHDFVFQCKDGTPLQTRLAASPFFDAEGRYAGSRAGVMDMTDMYTATAALEESERRYRSFFEQSPSGIFFYRLAEDGQLFLVTGNAAAERITGIPTDKLVGLTFEQAFPGLSGIGARFREVARTGQPWRQERLAYQNGTIQGVFSVAAFQTGPNSMAVFFHDVTDRHHMEETLRHSYEMLVRIMDSIPADVFVSDLNSYEILFMNRRMRSRFGENLEGRPCWQAFRGESGPCELCAIPQLLKENAPATYTWESENPLTGQKLLNLDTLIHWIDGRRAKLQVATDVTEMRQAQKALEEIEQRYQRLFESAVVGVFRSSARGRFLNANPALARILGYKSAKDLIEQVTDIASQLYLDPTQRQRFVALAKNEGGVAEQEVRMRRKDGSTIWVSESTRAAENTPDGETIFEGFITDITERRNIYHRLGEAKERAEQANKAKSEFLANMSHEIRTPLNGVLGMLQLIQLSSLNQEQEELVGVALSSGRSLLTLLNDILSLSQVEAGRMVLREEDFDLREIITLVVESLRPQSEAKGLILQSNVDSNAPCLLRTDKGRLRQVLFNLVGNAIKFTDKGSITVQASYSDSDQQKILRLRVSDTGIGIPEDQIERIFESFTQVDGSHTRRYQGAGLGLSIVRRLVQLMGGDVRIESAPGQGTQVQLLVPVKPAAETTTLDAGICPPLPVASAECLRILLAEDDRVNRITAKRLLDRLGYTVRCVETGLEALQALTEESFDCILMDVQMPELGGVEATRRIRAGESGINPTGIVIIALTAHAMEGDRETFLAAGMNDYLAKPVELQELQHTLRRKCGLGQA